MKNKFAFLVFVFLAAFAMASNAVFGLYPTTHPCLMYRYDLARSGTTTSTAPNENKTLWTRAFSTSVGTPIVVDGKVIFNCGSKMIAVDETTGIKLWESISFPSQLQGVPAFVDGKLYVGSYGGYLYCLDAATGTKLWEYDAYPARIERSPAVSRGRVYFGTTDHYLYAINASTGLSLSPPWRYTAPDSIYTSPAIDGDLIYFGCDDGKLYALNASGTLPALKWVYPINGRIRCTPVVYGNLVIFGSYTQDHSIFALNKTSGQKIWKYTFSLSWTAENPVVVADGIVYVAPSSGNKVYALYADATPGNYSEADPDIRKWSQSIDAWNPSEPVVADNKIFVATTSKLYALDISDGHRIWTYTFSGGGAENPIIADGRVFISRSNDLYCFGNPYPPVTYYYTVTPTPGNTFTVRLDINATPSSQLDTAGLVSLKKIRYTLEGIPGTTGMSNITIPNLMLGGPYVVMVDGGFPQYQATPLNNGTHTSLYFTYLHSIHTVEIIGTTAIPEASSNHALPLLIIISLMAVFFIRKLH